MKHHNRIWQAFLIGVAAVGLWYSAIAAYTVFLYSRLNQETPAASVTWKVKKGSADAYFLYAHYQFTPPNHPLQEGETILSSPVFWNVWAAEQAMEEYGANSWTVFYSGSNPAFSTLEKNYPFKECLSAFVTVGIFLYFLWLDHYVAKFRS